MQTMMVMEPCCRCGQPIAPGEPAMQTASVDMDEYGRAVSSPVKSCHLSGRCYEEHRRPESRLGYATKRLDACRAYRQVVLPVSRPGLDGNVKREEKSQ